MSQLRRALPDSERLDWIRLIRTENVGPITFHRLLDRYRTAGAALEALPELARQGGRIKPLTIPAKALAERELAAAARFGGRILCSCEPEYPQALAAIDDAPPVMTVRGHAHLLDRRAVALVGARNASLNGRKFAEQLARDLAEAGFLVVSGLARGIDTAAHHGALTGGTAAVLAGGADVVYPEENQDLYDAIAAQGVIVAECPPGTQPQARHFPRRNRIISGLSLGVVVVEAATRSGSLITARMALDQGREVMAVPGSPFDPRCQGTNGLIKQGAALIENAADAIRILESGTPPLARERERDLFDGAPPAHPDSQTLDRARSAVRERLSPSPVGVDELIRDTGLGAPAILTVLLELELAGTIERQPGNRVALTGSF
jgi:DNA processing protein